MKLVYLGLGSNIGDREGWLTQALDQLEAPDLQRQRVSGIYETEPMGLREQTWFLNLVAEFRTELFPKQLLHRVQKVEMKLGRKRSVRNGPRTIDIDVLLYGDSIVKTEELEIPHPRLRERRFVLEPLAELNPALRDPMSGHSVSRLLKQVQDQTVRRFPLTHEPRGDRIPDAKRRSPEKV